MIATSEMARAAELLLAGGYLKPEAAATFGDEYLGGGCYASVYGVGTGFAAKITGDRNDAKAAWHVRELQRGLGNVVSCGGHLMPSRGLNIVRVHAIYDISHDGGRWLIVSERLNPLPTALRDLAENYRRFTLFGIGCVVRGGNRICNGLYQHDTPGLHWIAAALNAAGIYRDLMAAGVTEMTDWHHGNIMWRPASRDPSGHGRVVLADLGCSRSSRQPVWDVPRGVGKCDESVMQNAA